MAFYLNQFHVMGNLVADPEMKKVGADKKVCKFRIAVNNPHNENALFFMVDVWGKEGEKCGMLKKGAQVFITNASILPKTFSKQTSCGEEVKVTTFAVNVDGYCGRVQFGVKNQDLDASKKPSKKYNKEVETKSESEPIEKEEPPQQEETSSFEEEFEF
jgi:single-stranded DNA-binding protein